MRVLDSKREHDAEAIASAPRIADFYSAATAEHFAIVQAGLASLGIPFAVEPRLVRGLDYYRRTIFEYQGATLDSAQNALGGGGRYDGLVEDLGGPSTPGIGFALGVDRTLLACDDEGVFDPPATAVAVFVVDTTGGEQALLITDELRGRRRLGRSGLRGSQHEEPDEGRRPQRRAGCRHHRQRRARRRHRGGPPAPRQCNTTTSTSCPEPISSSPSRRYLA